MNRTRLSRIGALLVVLYALPAGLDLASASLGAKARNSTAQNIVIGNFRTEVTATVGTQNLTTLSLTTGATNPLSFKIFYVQNFGTIVIAKFTITLSTITNITNLDYCTGTTGAFSTTIKASCTTGTLVTATAALTNNFTLAVPAGTRIAFEVVSNLTSRTTVASISVGTAQLNAGTTTNS